MASLQNQRAITNLKTWRTIGINERGCGTVFCGEGVGVSFEIKIESLFKRLNLIDFLIIELHIDSQEFINKLRQIVDEAPPYLLDELYGSKKMYVGSVEEKSFFLRKKRKFMNIDIQQSRAKGTINFENNKTKLEIKILGFDFYSVASIIIGPIAILMMFLNIIINEAYPALILLVPIGIFFLKLPYYLMKKNMKRFKKELEENVSFLNSQD